MSHSSDPTDPAGPSDAFVDAATAALRIPVDPQWKEAVRINLAVILAHADTVTAFALPDDAESAPVFEA
jgi:alpha-beta hydrolase superfamily lysophospholipase